MNNVHITGGGNWVGNPVFDSLNLTNRLRTNTIDAVGALSLGAGPLTQTINIGVGDSNNVINIGTGNGNSTITIGGAGDTVNIAGTLNTVSTTNTQVKDKSLVLNSGGTAASAGDAGLYFEENGVNTGYIKLNADRNEIHMVAPALKDVSNAPIPIMLNQALRDVDGPTFLGLTISVGGKIDVQTSLADAIHTPGGIDANKLMYVYQDYASEKK